MFHGIGNRPQGSAKLYYAIAALLSINVSFLFGVGLYEMYTIISKVKSLTAFWLEMGTQTTLRNIFISLASSYGIFIISAIIYIDAFHIFTTILQYIILIPTWINIFTVYAFANLHDTSWGTKGATILQNQPSRLKSMLLDETERDDLQQVDMEVMERQHRINLWELSKPALEEKFSTDKKTRLDDYFRY
jgi:chitin synthase